MIKIDVRAEVDEATRYLDRIQSQQIPYATKNALNATAFKVKQAVEHEIRDSFDRPTPWIQRSVRYQKAEKNNLTASVGFDLFGNKTGVTAGKVLRAQIYGGERRLKRFEVALRRKGVLPEGMFAVPGAAAKDLGMIDAFGNMKGSVIVQILSKLGAFQEMGFNANARANKRKRDKGRRYYWVGKPGRNTPLGIWLVDENARGGHGGLRPIIMFVDSTNYEKRFDFFYAATAAAKKHFASEFNTALTRALATAR